MESYLFKANLRKLLENKFGGLLTDINWREIFPTTTTTEVALCGVVRVPHRLISVSWSDH